MEDHDYNSEDYSYPIFDYNYNYHYDDCENCTLPEVNIFEDNPPFILELSLLVLSLLVGVPANIGVIYRVLKVDVRSITSTYILHRAVADLMFFIGNFFKVTGFFMAGWPFGDVMCKLVSALLQVPVFASAMFLALMNLDLFLVLKLDETQSKRKRQQVMRGGAASVWIITFVVAIPVYLYSYLHAERHRICWVIPLMTSIQRFTYLEIAILVFCCVCPLCICWITYIRYSKAFLSSESILGVIQRNKKLMLVLNLIFTVCQNLYWLSRSYQLPFSNSMGAVVMFVILHYCLELSLVLSAAYTFYSKSVKRAEPEEHPVAMALMS